MNTQRLAYLTCTKLLSLHRSCVRPQPPPPPSSSLLLLYSLVARWQWRITTICCMVVERERDSSGRCWQLSDHLVPIAVRFSFWLVGQLVGPNGQLHWRREEKKSLLMVLFQWRPFLFLSVVRNAQWPVVMSAERQRSTARGWRESQVNGLLTCWFHLRQ